jgi:hypothetical protein
MWFHPGLLLPLLISRALLFAVLTTAEAQQAAIPLIGYLSARSLADPAHLVAAFHQSLREGGFVEGTNVTVEHRWADGPNTTGCRCWQRTSLVIE